MTLSDDDSVAELRPNTQELTPSQSAPSDAQAHPRTLDDEPPLKVTVERLLSDTWGGDVRLRDQETLRNDKCFRFSVAQAPADSPQSVIVKKARSEPGVTIDPDDTKPNPAQRFLEEWAGLSFLNSVMPNTGFTSELYAGDRSACVVVYEDFGKGSSLADVLMGNDPDYARECLVLHAQAVAELHANTLPHEARFWQIRDGLGPRGTFRDSQGWGDLRLLKAELQRGFEQIGQQVPSTFWEEYAYLTAVVENPSPFRSYTHNDSCPDNTFIEPGRLRLIDFERGGFHLCLLDAAYCRLSMPHCFYANRLPEDVAPRVETAYRQRLKQTLVEAGDDRQFGNAMTEACAYWVISNGMWLVHRNFGKDFIWGTSTWWQRVYLRLEQFAATAEEFSHLPAMGTAARETLRRLEQFWNCDPMPLYPAFR